MDVEYKQNLQFTNVFENETFAFPLILVKGLLHGNVSRESDDIVVNYLRNSVVIRSVTTEVRRDKFTLLLDLEPGKNEFVFNSKENTKKTAFFYAPPIQKFVVTPLYIICQDNNNATHKDISTQIICDRILVGCRLVQTLIAETLFHCGFGKKTFLLENDDPNGNNGCLVFSTKLSFNATSDMSSEELWEYFGRELMTSEYGRENRKFLAFFTRKKGKYLEQLAIGGGGLALCDAEYLNTWPSSIDQLNHCFLNGTSITQLPSLYNTTHSYCNWNYFSTSIGAVCHELCHTFDLGHTVDGIMGKDFDHINLILVSGEDLNTLQKISNSQQNNNESLILSKGNSNRQLNINYSVQCTPSPNRNLRFSMHTKIEKWNNSSGEVAKIIFWSEGCATLLAYHKWINHTRLKNTEAGVNINQSHSSPIRYDHVRGIITSIHGIVVIQLRHQNGLVLKSWKFCTQQKKTLFLIPMREARRAGLIIVEDVEGNLIKKEIEHVL